MADYRIWGRVEQMAGSHFFVIASAAPERANNATTVRTLIAIALLIRLSALGGGFNRWMQQIGEIVQQAFRSLVSSSGAR